MAKAGFFSILGRIKGVQGCILVDAAGKIIANDFKAPEGVSKMVASCGQAFASVGGKRFKYASFSRQNNNDILIFPVGKYYLGVVTQSDTLSFHTAEAVMEILNVLAAGNRIDREAP